MNKRSPIGSINREHLDNRNELRTTIDSLRRRIEMLENKRTVNVDLIEFDTNDLIQLLGVSKTTIQRWRNSKAIPYNEYSARKITYSFRGVYQAIKTGQAYVRGMKRLDILKRLNNYKDDLFTI